MGDSNPSSPAAGDWEITGQPVYSIGAVGRMVGVPAATLRTWQERYRVVVPERSEGGHRLYSRDQVEQLRFLADQVAAGLSPADAHRLLRERLAAALRPPEADLETRAADAGDERPATRTGEDAGPGDGVGPGPDPGPDGAAPVTAHPRATDTLLILLAERDPYAAEFAEYFLRTEGYRVALALDAEDALAKVAEAPPDLMIVDLMISAGRGLELCRQLADHSDSPVLAICTLGLGDAALTAGATAFLPKPIEPLQLVSAVRDLLGRSAFLQRERATP